MTHKTMTITFVVGDHVTEEEIKDIENMSPMETSEWLKWSLIRPRYLPPPPPLTSHKVK